MFIISFVSLSPHVKSQWICWVFIKLVRAMFGWRNEQEILNNTFFNQLTLLTPCVHQNFGMFNTSNTHSTKSQMLKTVQMAPTFPFLSVTNIPHYRCWVFLPVMLCLFDSIHMTDRSNACRLCNTVCFASFYKPGVQKGHRRLNVTPYLSITC